MASTTYRIFGNPPANGSANLYQPSGALRPYNSGTNPTTVGTTTAGAINPAGGFQPTSYAFNAMQPKQAQATIKNPAISDRIGQGFRQNDINNLNDQTSLADFTKQYINSNPVAKAATDQETGAIGKFYNGGVQSDLNALADRSLAANNLAGARALGQAGRQSAIWRMSNGDSSYADRQLADQYSNIAIQNAVRDAQLRQQNYGTVLSGQQANLGVRNKLMDQYLQRMLVPGQTANTLLNSQLSTLGNLSNLDQSNTIYGAPEGPVVAPISANQQRANDINDQIRRASVAYYATPHGAASLTFPLHPYNGAPIPNTPSRVAYPAPWPGQQGNVVTGEPYPVGLPVNQTIQQAVNSYPPLTPQYGPQTNPALPQSTRLLNNGVNYSYNPAYPTGY